MDMAVPKDEMHVRLSIEEEHYIYELESFSL
jgi:hypothetical protein